MGGQEKGMLDTVIVGGGLCGLALAYGLTRQERSYVLFEARQRLGGRILSARSVSSGAALDLGPTWFCPDSQPGMKRLVDELGIEAFPQHDTGDVLGLTKAEGKPESLGGDGVHNGAHRIEGGMTALVEALAAHLPAERLQLGQVLTAVEDRGDHVVLTFRRGDAATVVKARRVILAIPPRLLEARVRFEPELDGECRRALRVTPTWMAAEARVVVGFKRAFWRQAGLSGNGFVALSPEQRGAFGPYPADPRPVYGVQ